MYKNRRITKKKELLKRIKFNSNVLEIKFKYTIYLERDFLKMFIYSISETPIKQWLRRLTSDRVYSRSNLALVRTIFFFVKNTRRLTNPGEGKGKSLM